MKREAAAARRRLNVLQAAPHPAYVVWELTLRCDHACTHCGSRAVLPRDNELTTSEALGVIEQLAAMGAREVVLIGGEAYLHEGFLRVVAALRDAGITPVMTSGGLGITSELAREMARAGMQRVSVSIDGLQETHDRMRAKNGSFAGALAALSRLASASIDISANTNLNRFNQGDLEALYEVLKAAGVRSWQVQLTVPLGRAADRPDMLLQPWDLLTLVPRVAALKARGLSEGLLIMPGNNLGYFGPEEALLRSQKPGDGDHFRGCMAGRFVLGIESDGAVKGCPSLQTAYYVGGSLREHALRDIWDEAPELAFTRARDKDELWGFCATCPFAEVCMGGCSFTAHALFGQRGNNPYCHFRARTLAARGERERLVMREAAPGEPFDHGLFDLVLEPLDAPESRLDHGELVRIRKPKLASTR